MQSTKQNWTRFGWHWLLTIVPALLLLPMLTGCSAKRPLVRTETVTQVVTEYRPLPSGLTDLVKRPVPPSERMTWADIAKLGLAWRKVALQYERQLLKIQALEQEQ